MEDAQLVAEGRRGDRRALATIYDAYADRIHDFAAAVLYDRAEAAETVQETFLAAFENLDSLAEPARLRTWLYALAHRSLLDRPAPAAARLGAPAGDVRLSRSDLADFVEKAAAGLELRDRVLLDLFLRQGLDGRELAAAAGEPASQLEDRLSALEAQVDRSLGALTVARTGRRACPDLFGLTEGDPPMTPEFRRRVTAHVDECERCNPRRRIAPRPTDLLTAAPALPAPSYLRGVVLGRAELVAVERAAGMGGRLTRAGWAFQRDGFPVLARTGGGSPSYAPMPIATVDTDPAGTPTVAMAPADQQFLGAREPTVVGPPPAMVGAAAGGSSGGRPGAWGPPGADQPPESRRSGRHDRLGMVIGALAGLIILIVAAIVALSSRGKTPPLAVSTGATTTAATASSTTTPTTVFSFPTTLQPTTTVLATGRLAVGARSLDLGTSMGSTTVAIGNSGTAPLDFTAQANGAGLSVDPVSGTLAPAASQALTVTLDRLTLLPGPYNGSIQVATRAGTITIPVTANVDQGPQIDNSSETPKYVSPTGCTNKPTTTRVFTAMVTAQVSATQPVTVVVLHSKDSASTTEFLPRPMSMSGTVYTATLGPYPSGPATIDWWITAIDQAGVTAMSQHGGLQVLAC